MKYILLGIVVITISLILKSMSNIDNIKETFKNDGLINCHGLILNNQDWRLSGNNLINNNLAGYLNIEQCVIQK